MRQVSPAEWTFSLASVSSGIRLGPHPNPRAAGAGARRYARVVASAWTRKELESKTTRPACVDLRRALSVAAIPAVTGLQRETGAAPDRDGAGSVKTSEIRFG